MKFLNPYLDDVEKINILEHWILLNCYFYYIKGQSRVEDYLYNENAKQLEDFIKSNPDDFKKSRFYSCFKNFDVSTGFDLWYKLDNYEKQNIINLVEMLEQ